MGEQWGDRERGMRMERPRREKGPRDLGRLRSRDGTGGGNTPAEDQEKVGPATWLSLQPFGVPTPTPTGIPGILLGPPSSFSPLALLGSQGQEPPNYFQMWTEPRGEGGGGSRGRGDEGEAAARALRLNLETGLPELPTFALLLCQLNI